MIDEKFKEIIQSKTGCAVIMAGSGSDILHITKIIDSLRTYTVPHMVRIISAHKQPQELLKAIDEYNSIGGLLAYVAVAGGTDALSGTLSFNALGPVISCPPDAPNNSCLTNPPGSSNVYIARPANVGRFIAQMYSGLNPRYRQLLERTIQEKITELDRADIDAQKLTFIDEPRGGN